MKYRKDKHGNDVSILGFGCMRFTGHGPVTDYSKAEREIMAAFKAGVNYYDTAYIYQGSEMLIGRIFESNGIRNQVRIATKLPHYLLRTRDDFDKYFNEQLERLRTDHVEYYLMHMLNDVKSWERIRELGAVEWITEKKEKGQIGQIGFSYHGNSDKFCELLDAWDWDFCQIQYNYYDEHSQAGRTGYDHAVSKGIPIVIMEPLRGGKLAHDLPKEAEELFCKFGCRNSRGSSRSPAEWGLRWLWDQPGIMCVLSGMNSLEMVDENCAAASDADAGCMTYEEHQLLQDVISIIRSKTKVPCTGCRYCMPCPANVDIPGTFAAYNNRYVDGFFTAEKEYMMCTTLRKDVTAAGNCVGCGKCENHCPQGIAIRDELKRARKVLEGPVYKIARKLAPLVYKY